MNLNIACIQFCASNVVEYNIRVISKLITEAAKGGADLICTPEMTNLIERNSRKLFEKTTNESSDTTLSHCRALAKELKVNLLIGSLAIQVNPSQCLNRSYFVNSEGNIVAHYDKINLFDITLADGTKFQESKSYQQGSEAVIANHEPWQIGMTICYDLRFPQLYRYLSQHGANIISVPAAFTQITGQAHWHSLLRARAIENCCYIIAPAQCGQHSDGSQSYGHSMIINPWGEILAKADGNSETVIFASINTEKITEARNSIPSWAINAEFSLKSTP